MPTPVQQRPRLRAGLHFYLYAYDELATTRSIGMGVGPIPWTAIVQYARIYRVRDLEHFTAIIRGVDAAMLKQMLEAAEPRDG